MSEPEAKPDGERSGGVLSSISVVEVGEGIPLGYCGKLFADLGADVVKVEAPPGDPSRQYIGQHLHLNTNKRSVVLDVDDAADRERLGRLIANADLVIESTAPGMLDGWCIGWDQLRESNAALVMVSITPFGQDGPYAAYKAPEIVAFAMGGSMNATGTPDREPVKLAANAQSHYAGNVAAVGALGALEFARRTGRGTHVDASTVEALMGSFDRRAVLLLGYQYVGIKGNRAPASSGALPTGVFACADGFVNFMTIPAHAGRMCDAMQNERLRAAFSDVNNLTGSDAKRLIREELDPWLAAHTKLEITRAAQAAKWPGVAVNTPLDLLECDHLQQRDFWVDHEHPVAGKVKLLGPPYRFADGGVAVNRPAPSIGEHTAEVLAELDRDPTPPVISPAQPEARLPLEGIRVADLTIVWSGPFATMLLADLGAEVIRVENPFVFPPATKGMAPRPPFELTKALGPLGMGYAPVPEGAPDRPYNRIAANNAVTRNKRSCTVDLRRPEGLEILDELIMKSDVLVENFAAGTLEKIGISTDDLLARNPRLIILRLPPLGSTGEWSHYTGFGASFEALSGFTSLWGYLDADASSRGGTAYMDGATGPAGAFAVLAALQHRERTGRGQVIELAQSENMMQHVGEVFVGCSMTGENEDTWGNRDRQRAPQGVYACAGEERWLALSVGDDEEWAALCAVMDVPELATDERFVTAAARRANHDDIDALIAGWAASRDVYDAFHALQRAGVPAGPVLDEEMAYADPHMAARQFFQPLSGRETGTHLYAGHFFKGVPQAWTRGGPALGEDNEYVYKEILGFSDEDYRQLEKSHHIAEDYLSPDGQPL
jgi:crotonobetainyl-CoA:carnitine CoA-transferase CaiB-like acyl-CoA transferase